MLVDSHCHLDRLDLGVYQGDLKQALQAAREQGVSHMLCVCIDQEGMAGVLDIAHDFPSVYASVGVHPSSVDADVVSPAMLKSWADTPKVVALGETGLDYHYSGGSADFQKLSFANHLVAAGELGLPVIVHTREAREDTLDLIRNYGNTASSGVLHCFTESWEMAKKAMDMNYYISISGIVTFNSASELREVVKKMPLERLLVETDSPYLAPVPFRGKPNEPKYVKAVAEYVAELRGICFEELCEVSSDNFFRLFNRAKRA
ncbi:MAG: hydrolase TatD [Alteromonadaceae bacterium]|nr:MAG: hydrolase TatD [Alteromonadaceae bacterium]